MLYEDIKLLNDKNKNMFKEYYGDKNCVSQATLSNYRYKLYEKNGRLYIRNNIEWLSQVTYNEEVTDLSCILHVLYAINCNYITNISLLTKYKKLLYDYVLDSVLWQKLHNALTDNIVDKFFMLKIPNIKQYISKSIMFGYELLLLEHDTVGLLKKDNNFYCISDCRLILLKERTFSYSTCREIYIENLDIKELNTLESMFESCFSLERVVLKNFNMINVISMRNMFKDCGKLVNVEFGFIDTRNLKDLTCMFENCKNLIDMDLSEFNTYNVRSIKRMFKGCSELKTINMSNCYFDKLYSMESFIKDCNLLEKLILKESNLLNIKNVNRISWNANASNCTII